MDRSYIVIITALTEERDAVLKSLSNVEKLPIDTIDSRIYFRGQILYSDSLLYSIIVLCLPNMGRVAATGAALDALTRWRPRAVFLIGIAGGVAKNDVCIGDVLVAQQVVDYEVQKVTEEDISPRFQSYRVDAKLYNICQNILPSEWNDLHPQRPSAGEPQVRFGPMASGDKVVAKKDLLDLLLGHYPKLVGVEMEAAGVADAVSHSQWAPRLLMIRGVSDLADSYKDSDGVKAWRTYACDVAVSFLHALLRQDITAVLQGKGRRLGEYDEEKSMYLEELAALEEQRCRGKALGRDVSDVTSQILELRRDLRAGPTLSVGDFLSNGRYELMKKLGSGGFATVWKAIDHRANDIVALKVLHNQWATDKERINRFNRGATKMKRLGHPHIVQVFEDSCAEDGYLYYTMEYAGPQNLRQQVLRSPIESPTPSVVLKPIFQIGSALSFAHSKGCVHRDIKPQNVILDEAGNAKLTDFDLVWVADTTGGTRTGALGTFVFAAPEALRDASQAASTSDVFSLAMVATFVLAQKELDASVFRDPAGYISSLENVPKKIKKALTRATEWDDAKRTQDVDTFLAELRFGLNSIDDEGIDAVSWLDGGGFARSCVTKYRAAYTEVRSSSRWPLILTIVSELATEIFQNFRTAFESSSDSFNLGTFNTYLRVFEIQRVSTAHGLSLSADEERIIRWLAARRVIILTVELYNEFLEGERGRLETLVTTFLNFVPAEERDPRIVVDKAKRTLFRVRPLFTQWGLSASELLGGVSHLATASDNELIWTQEMMNDYGDLEVKMPSWWKEVYSPEHD